MNLSYSRRRFLRTTALGLGVAGLPHWYRSEAQDASASASAATVSPNDRPRIALVGCGNRGKAVAKRMERFGDVVSVCDVDASRVEAAKALFAGARGWKDFRDAVADDGVDVVLCGTVDHWHALVSIAAMEAGKDVYCEKPLTLTIDEGRRIADAARRTGRVLQTGSQQRSAANFRMACELVRNGRLGALQSVETWLPAGPKEGPFRAAAIPNGLDWDLWKGPTPDVAYVPERCHRYFRYWYEYSGGTMTDWGAHHNDIALWALDRERSGPTQIVGRAVGSMIDGGYTAASEFDVTYTYEDGLVHRCRSTRDASPSGVAQGAKQQHHGIRFVGEKGWIWVTRWSIEASNPAFLETPLPSNATRLPVSGDHEGNFFDAVKRRASPICDAEIGHRSASICHLGVLSMRLGRELSWDPVAEQFVGDDEANGWLARDRRDPWDWERG